MNIAVRKVIAKVANPFYPSYSGCLRCNRNWKICQSHTTQYTPNGGMFPLCEECWQELTIAQRLVYYRMLWSQWRMPASNSDYDELRSIEAAVKQGL